MRKTTFFITVFAILTLTLLQLAQADYRITNGNATETAWVIYTAWRPASQNWPAGWRTQGWYEVKPGRTRNFPVPVGNTWVYIRVERSDSTEIRPTDHLARDSTRFWRHPSKAFTVVETHAGSILKSNHKRQSLEKVNLYAYRNGGSHTITDAAESNPPLPSERIYDQAMRAVVWILNIDEKAEGSGVLIDHERKLAVTNAHVTESVDWVTVCFLVQDQEGKLIDDRNYYMRNYESLRTTSYATLGRVIAEDSDRDLAIIQLDSLPETAHEIDHDFSSDLSRNIKRNTQVHILGNPEKLDLWHWTVGFFQADTGDWLYIKADIFGGNSGGPVLNGRGQLIGIVSSSDEHAKAWAVPSRYVKTLLDTIGPKHTFGIINSTGFAVPYQTKWARNDKWKQQAAGPGQDVYHWWNREEVPWGYPKIRFDNIIGDGRVTYSVYTLDTSLRYFGPDYQERLIPDDASTYAFSYNWRTRRLTLSPEAGAAPLRPREVPEETALLPNYPNPFNPETWIPYQLAEPAEVTVSIYSIDRGLIRILSVGHQPAGRYRSKSRAVYWNGKNAQGEPVASGLYFYRLKAGRILGYWEDADTQVAAPSRGVYLFMTYAFPPDKGGYGGLKYSKISRLIYDLRIPP